jgi:hypothetical protein
VRRAGGALLVAVVAGCAPAMPPPHPDVAGRPVLPSCGVEDLRGGSTRERANVDARRCIIAAWEDREPAELTRYRPNIEGQPPVTEIVRVLGDGRVELFHFAGHGGAIPGFWRHSTCDDLLYGDRAPVQPPEAADELAVFIPSECEARDLTP